MKNEKIYRETKVLCTRSKLPASDYVINPYIGCIHRCRYCYASFMGRFTGHTEEWGTYLEPKKYVSYKLPSKLDQSKTILIGSVTDAYNPAEKEYCLMPKILKSLQNCPAHVEVLTKSSLVLRDIDLLKRIPDIAVGISLSNLDEADNKVIEPGASSATERLRALRELHEHGISTYIFIAPYLPGITNLNVIYEACKDTVDYICVENLNLRGSYKQTMLDIISKLHPDLRELWLDIYMRKKANIYWREVEIQIEALQNKSSIPIISYMYHEKIKKS